MPEIKESGASEEIAKEFHENEPQEEQKIKAIYVDATAAEQSTHPRESPGRLGMVYELQASSKIQRGQCGAQSSVYPPKYANREHISAYGLTLSDVVSNPRNVMLKFLDSHLEEYWLQVCTSTGLDYMIMTHPSRYNCSNTRCCKSTL